jgi:hypothetical protein
MSPGRHITPATGHPETGGDFARRYCLRYGCQAGAFENHLLRRGLPAPVRPFAWLIWAFDPNFFQADMLLIAELRYATSFSQARDILNAVSLPPGPGDRPRPRLKIRMSAARLQAIARTLYRDGEG